MLRKSLTQVGIKNADTEQIMENCHDIIRRNDPSYAIENELASWINLLDKLGKRPDDVPLASELSKLSSIQIEELWLHVGMIKESLTPEEIEAYVKMTEKA